MTRYIISIVLITLLIFTIFKGESQYEGTCKKLEGITLDKEKLNYLQNWVNNFEKYGDVLKSEVTSSGFIDAYKYPNHFNLDWSLIGIPEGLASIRVNGENINYLNLDYKRINSISVGYGGRSFLVFKYKKSKAWGMKSLNINEEDKRVIDDSLMVVCRQDN